MDSQNSAEIPKKRKISDEKEQEQSSCSSGGNNVFKGFSVVNVLNENAQTKMMCVEGRFAGRDDPAVVIVEKTPFSRDSLGDILSERSDSDLILQNDIYGTHSIHPEPRLNGVKTTLIYPATQKHITKYLSQEVHLISETPENYENITRPHLDSTTFSIQWVYNILAKKTEAERIVYEDPDPELGFILLPDMKWNGKQVEDLYLVAIVHKHGIRSLRELNDSHLPLLSNILTNGQKAIEEKYNVPPSKLRVYLHYQPSYYHLHVHFTHIKYNAPGSGVERAHLLNDVIDNIKLDNQFYKKKTLTFMVKENEGLFQKYREAGKV